MRPAAPVPPLLLLALGLLLALPPPPVQAQAGAGPEVLVVGQEAEGDFVNLTVTARTRLGEIRLAGLYAGDALASDQPDSLWVYPGGTAQLSFRMKGSPRDVELRLSFTYGSAGAWTTVTETTALRIDDAADVRPVRTVAEDGNVTLLLRNFGQANARGLMASLLDKDGAPIGDPYYVPVGLVPGNGTAEVAFTLAGGSDRGTLRLESPYGTSSFPVLLTGGAAGGDLRLEADSPSIEGAPGSTVDFHLRLSNRGAERAVDLGTSGLPSSLASTLTVQGTRAQTVRLAAGETKGVTLSVAIPATGNLTSVAFAVTAQSGAARAEAPLTIVVAGHPRLELTGRNWHLAVDGLEGQVPISVRNTGTAPAFDVALTAKAPAGWDVAADPQRIPRLDPGQEATVLLSFFAPDGTGEGRYVLDLGAQAGGVAARERSLTLELEGAAPSVLPWLLGAAAAVAGVTAFLVLMRRR